MAPAETYFIAECYRIDRTEMMIVFLHHLSASCIVLQDLFVGHAGQELVRYAGIDAHNMWSLSAGELVQAFPSLRVPKLHIPIIARRDELRSVWCEVDVVDRLVMARKCPQEFSLVVYVPQSNLGVC